MPVLHSRAGKDRISVPTARTSPYDHITTAIYPGCAVAKTDGEAYLACNEANDKDTPWGRDCTNPLCYGVPIYREFLTSGDATIPREWQKWKTAQLPTKRSHATP